MSKYDHTSPIENFDWSLYEAKPKGKISSKEPYAEELKTKMDQYWTTNELIEPKINEVAVGKVLRKTSEFAEVDVNWRESLFVDLSKENPDYIKYIQEGCEIEVYIKSVDGNSNGYSIVGSYSELIKQRKFEEIKLSIGKNVAFAAKVKSLVYGGYFLDLDGIEVFMPGSQGGMNKLIDFNSLVGTEIYVCPINYDSAKNYMVVSHRAYLKTQVPVHAEDLEQGQEKHGFVTDASKFGVFVEFDGCLTGLIHKSDLAPEEASKYTEGEINPGDKISFKIKEVVNPFRIVCTQKEIVIEADPWEDITSRYQVPSQVKGKIKKVARFGLFIEIEHKVTGLLHKSEYESLDMEFEAGQEITVDLYRIDTESKKLYFKL
jgi:4-hydroxy-3-methylbut-2-enyl diphosphate reductase